MMTCRQAALQPVGGGRSLADGIRAYLSPRVSDPMMGRQTERQEEKRCSGASHNAGIDRTERGAPTRNHGTQAVGRGIVEHGRKSPAAGRGRRVPEQGSPGDRQGPGKTGEEVRAKEQGHLRPGIGTLIVDYGITGHKDINPLKSLNKQDPMTLGQGKPGHLAAEEGALEALYCTEAILTTGRDAPAPNMGLMDVQGKQTLLDAGSCPGLQEDNQTLMLNNLSPKNGERRPPGLSKQLEDPEMDSRELLRVLPAKMDIQKLISAVEQSCLQVVKGLKEDTRALGHRVEKLENDQEAMVHVVVDVQDVIKKHEDVLNSYRDQLDDYENRERRQNIRIKGLPRINPNV